MPWKRRWAVLHNWYYKRHSNSLPNFWPFLALAVWRRGPGNVPNWISEELLHCHEETGHKETSEGYPETQEWGPCLVLWHIFKQKVTFFTVGSSHNADAGNVMQWFNEAFFCFRFEIAIFILIFLNMITMGIEHYNQSRAFTFTLEISNALFTTIFSLGTWNLQPFFPKSATKNFFNFWLWIQWSLDPLYNFSSPHQSAQLSLL